MGWVLNQVVQPFQPLPSPFTHFITAIQDGTKRLTADQPLPWRDIWRKDKLDQAYSEKTAFTTEHYIPVDFRDV